MMVFVALLAQFVGCAGETPAFKVDMTTSGTPVRCLASTIESIQIRGVSSPSINNENTRARLRTADGRSVQWDYMRSLHEGSRLVVGDGVFLLLGADGEPTGISSSCPPGL